MSYSYDYDFDRKPLPEHLKKQQARIQFLLAELGRIVLSESEDKLLELNLSTVTALTEILASAVEDFQLKLQQRKARST